MDTTLVLIDLVAVVDTVASALVSKYALSNYTFAVLMSQIPAWLYFLSTSSPSLMRASSESLSPTVAPEDGSAFSQMSVQLH